jgi:hypothetical protein
VNNAYQKINTIKTRWDESLMLATNSSRIVLAQPVSEMVSLHRDLANIEVPPCMETAKNALDQSMSLTIDGYRKFFEYENEEEISIRFKKASLQRQIYERLVAEIFLCSPFSCP